jgi:hypothetical protein
MISCERRHEGIESEMDMNPLGGPESHTWQEEPREHVRAVGVGQESKTFEEMLADIQYGSGKRVQRGRFSGLGVFAILLLLALGAGGVVGWLWGKERTQPLLPEGRLFLPTDTSVGYEGVFAGTKGWLFVSGGQVLQMEAPAEPSIPAQLVPQASTSPTPRERERTRKPASNTHRAYLGVRGKTFEQEGVQGVKILEVFPDSPAARAGLRSHPDAAPDRGQQSDESPGHIIVGANGQTIRSEDDLARVLALSSPGDVMQVIVTAADGSAREDFLIVLDELPGVSSPVNSGPK